MLDTLKAFDMWVRRLLTWFCAILLAMMVIFTVYTVFMRYVFLNPPVWGDQMAVFSCIWLVFIALALTTREKEHIALDMLYTYLPVKWAFAVQEMWNLIICILGAVLLVYGYDTAVNNFGKYWELNYMPKTWPMMILPVTGGLIMLGAFAAFLEDCAEYRRGDFRAHEFVEGKDFIEEEA